MSKKNKLCIYTKKCLLTKENTSKHVCLLINTHCDKYQNIKNNVNVKVYELLNDKGKVFLLSSDLDKEFYEIRFIEYDK